MGGHRHAFRAVLGDGGAIRGTRGALQCKRSPEMDSAPKIRVGSAFSPHYFCGRILSILCSDYLPPDLGRIPKTLAKLEKRLKSFSSRNRQIFEFRMVWMGAWNGGRFVVGC